MRRGDSISPARRRRPGGGGGVWVEETAAVRGLPYSRLTVGVPMERYPLERRVAATPEVRAEAGVLP